VTRAVPRIARVHITASDNDAVRPGLYRSLADADAMLAQAFEASPPPAGKPFAEISFSVIWTDGFHLDDRVYVHTRLVADAQADGLLRHVLLRSARVQASGEAFRGWQPDYVATLKARGLDLLRRIEADAPAGPRRNMAGPRWHAPTLMPDPTAALGRLRDRFARVRQVVAAVGEGEPETGRPGYPVTNHADIRYAANHVSLALQNDLRAFGATAAGVIWSHWRAVVETIEYLLHLGDATDEYTDNEGFWTRQLPALAQLLADARSGQGALRNARLTFRPVGGRSEPYPAWVQDLRDRSGVYVIREAGNPEVVYVGSSSADRLYETLTRHFQAWRRWKGYWRGQFAEGHDPGLTYDRDTAEAAVIVTPPQHALELESRFIRRLRPRDNLIGQPAAEELAPAPF